MMRLKNRLTPQSINKTTWCYLGANKVTIVHEVRDLNDGYRKTIQIKIPAQIIKKWFEGTK